MASESDFELPNPDINDDVPHSTHQMDSSSPDDVIQVVHQQQCPHTEVPVAEHYVDIQAENQRLLRLLENCEKDVTYMGNCPSTIIYVNRNCTYLTVVVQVLTKLNEILIYHSDTEQEIMILNQSLESYYIAELIKKCMIKANIYPNKIYSDFVTLSQITDPRHLILQCANNAYIGLVYKRGYQQIYEMICMIPSEVGNDFHAFISNLEITDLRKFLIFSHAQKIQPVYPNKIEFSNNGHILTYYRLAVVTTYKEQNQPISYGLGLCSVYNQYDYYFKNKHIKSRHSQHKEFMNIYVCIN